MPAVNEPRPSRPTNSYGQELDGFVESLESQAQNNWEAIEWFFRNHKEVRKAVDVYNAVKTAGG
jgi:hypothetical protein